MSPTPPDYRWKLVYFDEAEFTNADGEPWESPVKPILMVLQPGWDYDILRDVHHYLYDEELERWCNFDDRGLYGQLIYGIRKFSAYREGWMISVRADWNRIRDKYTIEVRGR